MLNRRILRIKAFKVLYSYAENPTMTLKEGLAQLEISCQSTRDLYLYMLSLVCALTQESHNRIEAAGSKFNPTEEEKHPNLKFATNGISKLLEEDPDFQKALSRKKLSWDQNDAFLRKLYETVRERDYFKKYMSGAESSLKEDADLFVTVFEKELVDSQDLELILEDMSIYWNDDLEYALSMCCRTVDSLAEGKRWGMPSLYKDEDFEFVSKLVRCAYDNFDRYYNMIAESVPKWDKDRLFIIDLVLIICGLAEAEHFDDIPNRVTVNEFVEISKFYSTPKSRSFVNGLLDKLIKNNLSLSLSDNQ